jgi:opacity protein-like surface antigen
MKSIMFSALMGALVLMCTSGFAQDKWAVEFRPGINFPTAELLETDLSTGFGFELTASYNFMSHLGVYAGWGWNKFNIDETSEIDEFDVEETGYTFGLQFMHPVGESDIAIFARAGAIYNHLELENSDGEISEDSGHEFGWQLAAGVSYQFSDSWHLRPEIRYRSLGVDFDFEPNTVDADLRYISVGIGIAKSF